MIFNLNEQKVLSDPSGSSVFKGEKDFNDIVVNLPDNVDGHTATELNYVMHFVDSDGGYSTKILTVDSSGGTLKATATVSTSITSKAQAFYAYVLMTDDEETVIGKTNGVIVMIHPVPDEENEIIPPADADKIIKGLEEIVQEATDTIEEATEALEKADNYNELKNKPSINNVTLSGNKSSDDLSLQGKLTAGNNITINNGVISASGGVTSYNDLENLPYIKYYTTIGGSPVQDSRHFKGFLADFLSGGVKIYNYGNDAFYLGLNPKRAFTIDTSTTNYDVDNTSQRQQPLIVSTRQNSFSNLPSFVSSKRYTQVFFIQFSGENANTQIQFLYWIDSNNVHHSAMRIRSSYGDSSWQEIGGGSQIVSAVVNANGTITFTDSDGNTFTTTGSSVIGPQGDDYVLTAQDKSDIADIVLSELPTTQGVLYGNANN